jgi:hypothetical protein
MKTKKALKRLKKVEMILSNVIEQLPVSARGLRYSGPFFCADRGRIIVDPAGQRAQPISFVKARG